MPTFFSIYKNYFIKTYSAIAPLFKYFVYSILFILIILTGYFIAIAPYDHQHQEYTLLIYLHAPIAWTGLNLYIINSINAIINIFYSTKTSLNLTKTISFPALVFLTLTLFTGSIWGKNSWGSYWVWDARITSVFILFIFYLIKNIILNFSYKNFPFSMISRSSFKSFKNNTVSIEKYSASKTLNSPNYSNDFKLEILNILSFTIIPIIIFSVNIWHTIHQGSSIQSNSIAYEILTPIKLMTTTLHLYIFIICYKRYQKII